MFTLILNSLIPLILITLVGVFLKIFIAKDSWVDTLNGVALYALFPVLILRDIGLIKLNNFIVLDL